MSRNRMNPLEEARELGEALSQRDVDEELARRIIDDFAHVIYWKDRAGPYRTLWINSGIRGYLSSENYKRQRS